MCILLSALKFHNLIPFLSAILRLAKRWVSAHLFSGCLAEEAIELLVAHVFLTPLPLGVPSSRINGFLRFLSATIILILQKNNQVMVLTNIFFAGLCNRFLRLLADYDWMFYPLIVDINNDFGRNDEKEINVSPSF